MYARLLLTRIAMILGLKLFKKQMNLLNVE
jgi:hypothetical protein